MSVYQDQSRPNAAVDSSIPKILHDKTLIEHGEDGETVIKTEVDPSMDEIRDELQYGPILGMVQDRNTPLHKRMIGVVGRRTFMPIVVNNLKVNQELYDTSEHVKGTQH